MNLVLGGIRHACNTFSRYRTIHLKSIINASNSGIILTYFGEKIILSVFKMRTNLNLSQVSAQNIPDYVTNPVYVYFFFFIQISVIWEGYTCYKHLRNNIFNCTDKRNAVD